MHIFSLFLLVACGTPKDSQPQPQETGKADTSETGGHTGADIVPGPAMPHEAPTAGAMCFDCHLCANDGASALEVTHWVCVGCHKGPDGSVPDEVQSGCGCGALDCSTDPPTLGCADCHLTESKDGMPTSDHMNELCTGCHVHGLP